MSFLKADWEIQHAIVETGRGEAGLAKNTVNTACGREDIPLRISLTSALINELVDLVAILLFLSKTNICQCTLNND